MVIFDGSADPIFPPNDRVAWYQEVDKVTGNVHDFARLFVVPGMTHCSGGNALDDFDPLTILENWREKGQAPDFLLARGSSPALKDKSQPVCAYPRIARYTGGDVNRADSFACR